MSYISKHAIILECKNLTLNNRFEEVQELDKLYDGGYIDLKILRLILVSMCRTTNNRLLDRSLDKEEIEKAANYILDTVFNIQPKKQ